MASNLPFITDILEYLKDYHESTGGKGPIYSSRFPWVADINSRHPLEFVSIDNNEPFWFFTPVVAKSKSGRKNHRSTSCGYGRWRGTSKVKEVAVPGGPTNTKKKKIGELRSFEFRVKNSPYDKVDVKTEFLMMEYRALISDGVLSRVAFCNIYVSPRARKNRLHPPPPSAASAIAEAESTSPSSTLCDLGGPGDGTTAGGVNVIDEQSHAWNSSSSTANAFEGQWEDLPPLLTMISDFDNNVVDMGYSSSLFNSNSSTCHQYYHEEDQPGTFGNNNNNINVLVDQHYLCCSQPPPPLPLPLDDVFQQDMFLDSSNNVVVDDIDSYLLLSSSSATSQYDLQKDQLGTFFLEDQLPQTDHLPPSYHEILADLQNIIDECSVPRMH